MISIENENLRAGIHPMGAELASLVDKSTGLEYIWQAGPEWPRHSPLLFPIVGQLRSNQYVYNGREYTLPRHGFARDKNFSLVEHSPNRLLFHLKEDEETMKAYPFPFILEVSYALRDNELHVTTLVLNHGRNPMYFSIGAHPAFRIPLRDQCTYSDYELVFEQEETADQWPLSDGLIDRESQPFLKQQQKIKLEKSLFAKDALVFKGLRSSVVTLRDKENSHGIEMKVGKCPYLGLWAKENADFICIEPWHGIADNVDASGKLSDKEGIMMLAPAGDFTFRYTLRPF